MRQQARRAGSHPGLFVCLMASWSDFSPEERPGGAAKDIVEVEDASRYHEDFQAGYVRAVNEGPLQRIFITVGSAQHRGYGQGGARPKTSTVHIERCRTHCWHAARRIRCYANVYYAGDIGPSRDVHRAPGSNARIGAAVTDLAAVHVDRATV